MLVLLLVQLLLIDLSQLLRSILGVHKQLVRTRELVLKLLRKHLQILILLLLLHLVQLLEQGLLLFNHLLQLLKLLVLQLQLLLI